MYIFQQYNNKILLYYYYLLLLLYTYLAYLLLWVNRFKYDDFGLLPPELLLVASVVILTSMTDAVQNC